MDKHHPSGACRHAIHLCDQAFSTLSALESHLCLDRQLRLTGKKLGGLYPRISSSRLDRDEAEPWSHSGSYPP